jgi:hypothetical protein
MIATIVRPYAMQTPAFCLRRHPHGSNKGRSSGSSALVGRQRVTRAMLAPAPAKRHSRGACSAQSSASSATRSRGVYKISAYMYGA